MYYFELFVLHASQPKWPIVERRSKILIKSSHKFGLKSSLFIQILIGVAWYRFFYSLKNSNKACLDNNILIYTQVQPSMIAIVFFRRFVIRVPDAVQFNKKEMGKKVLPMAQEKLLTSLGLFFISPSLSLRCVVVIFLVIVDLNRID